MRKPHSFVVSLVVLAVVFAGTGLFAGDLAGPAPERSEGPIVKSEGTAATAASKNAGDFLASLNKDEASGGGEREAPAYVTALSFAFKLALVLLLAYATICALKRFAGLKNGLGHGKHRIRVLEHAGLAANRSLHLVEVGSRSFLVSSTPSQVNLIAELRAEDLPEMEVPGQVGGFKDQLAGFLSQTMSSDCAARSVAQSLRESTSFLQDKVRDVGTLRRKFRHVEGQ